MGTGTSTLGKVTQIGQETVAWGTAVAATIKLPGVTSGSVGWDSKFVHPDEWGRLGGSTLFANTYLAGKATFGGECLPGYIDYWLNGMLTPPTVTGAGPYVWPWALPAGGTATVPIPQTIQHGNLGVQGYRMFGAFVSKLVISWQAGDTWKYAVDIMSKGVEAVTPTASLADQAPAQLSGAVYTSDAVGGTMGATAVAGALYGFQLTIENGLHLKQFGTAAPEGWGHNLWKTSLQLDVEYTSTTQANMVSTMINAGVVGQRQHSITGTAGTTSVQIQHSGTESGVPELWADRDGNRVIRATFEGTYNSGAFANFCKVISTWGANTLT